MAIKPAKFGPYFWGVLHLACLGGIDPTSLRTLIALFPSILPCGACGYHFSQVLVESPVPESDDPDILFNWSVDVHNTVNTRIAKPTFTYEEARAVWLAMPTTEPPKKDRTPILIGMLVVVMAIILLWKLSS